jgi:hypothetical protein
LPTFADPLFFAKYSWKNRRDSVVTIASRLPLYDHGWLPIVLKIHRTFLATLLRDDRLENDPTTYDGALLRYIGNGVIDRELIKEWSPPEIRCYFFCEQISLLLKDLATNPPPRRERQVSIPVFLRPKNHARFVVLRDNLPLIREFFSNPAPEGVSHVYSLTGLVQAFLVLPSNLRRINSPARGREFKKQKFIDLLPGAYFICNELVIRAKADEETREELSKLLVMLQIDDDLAKQYLEIHQGDDAWERLVAPCLVYWGFYGAWEILNVAPFRAPEDLSRQYLYGKKSQRIVAAMRRAVQRDPSVVKGVFENVKKLYLRERGAAAKAFDLV